MTSEDDIASAFAVAMLTFDRIDILMSNVGVIAVGPPPEIPLGAWSELIVRAV